MGPFVSETGTSDCSSGAVRTASLRAVSSTDLNLFHVCERRLIKVVVAASVLPVFSMFAAGWVRASKRFHNGAFATFGSGS